MFNVSPLQCLVPLQMSLAPASLTAVADPGGATGAPPPKIGSTLFFVIQFFIRILKNKAQIARESIKTTLELPGPLSGPWTHAESEFGSALVMCLRSQIFCALPLNENPGSAPAQQHYTLSFT